ncbi:MAG: hypothetical protein ACJAZP_002509 [Psychromonas sp.]
MAYPKLVNFRYFKEDYILINKQRLASTACIFLSALTINSVSHAADISNGTYILESQVSSSTDDAEERKGTIDISSSDLELIEEGNSAQTVGVRFANLTIPENAVISKAYIQYTVDERSDDNANLTIHGESIANAPRFSDVDYNISARTKTNTSVLWSPAVWNTVGAAGEDQRTPDLSSIVQEIISKTGWESDNAIAFILSGAGTRIAESYDGDQAGAAQLYLEYTIAQSTEQPIVEQPIVEQPIVEQPIVEEPIVEEPVVEEPTVEEPVVEEPTVVEPVVEEPTVEEPVVEEPTVVEPVVEEPIVEEPIVEEPIVVEPVVEEPIVVEPVVEEPIVVEPVVEQPIVDEPVSSFDLLNVTGSNNDLIAGTYTSSNSANVGTQSKRSIHQGGFGTDSVCGLNGEVIKVSNLNDSGAGSLRDAINQKGPRTIVFEVSGAIKLQSKLVIESPFVTIAGQTAPAPGISLYHEALKVDTHDVCMQHIRVRLGDSDYNLNPMSESEAGDADALVIRGGRDSEGTYNVVLDNMSVSWSVDESISVFGGVSNLTIRDSIIAEPLRYNAHGKDHAYCLLIRSETEKVSLIGNLFGHCQRRSPRMDGGTLQYVNNFVYNPGEYAVSVHDLPIDVTMVGNVMDFPDDSADRYQGGPDEFFASRSPSAKVYFLDNKSFENRPMHDAVSQGEPVIIQSVPHVWAANVTPLTATEVEESISDWVGAFPRNRDEVDTRIIEGVRTHSGTYLDSQMDNGGYVYVEENNRLLTPPTNPQNDDDKDGISNLVEWLQSYTDAIE